MSNHTGGVYVYKIYNKIYLSLVLKNAIEEIKE